jgi:hypothetical protein
MASTITNASKCDFLTKQLSPPSVEPGAAILAFWGDSHG